MVAFCVAMLFFGEGFENAVVQNLYKICTIRLGTLAAEKYLQYWTYKEDITPTQHYNIDLVYRYFFAHSSLH